ncbi:MAG: TIGR03016 family PEP-CTERM system-associated outer membrane protein [Woeseia sp.]
MDTTDTSRAAVPRRRARITFALAGLAPLVASTGFSAEFVPEVTIGITHTDNVALASDDEDAQSEKIYRIEPSFHLSHEAPRITTNVDYLLQAYRYHDLGENEVFHQYDASIRAALIPDNLFMEIGGSRSQSITDPEQNIPQGNLPISSNRQNRDDYYAAPSFQYAFGRNVVAAGEYRHSWVEYGEADAQGSQNQDADFSIDNYRKERGLTWALRYDWQRTEYDLEIPWEYQRATAELGFWAGTNTRLFAAAGKESAWDMPLDPKMEDDLWEVGFARQIGQRLSAEFAGGERSFGSSWRGNLELQFNRGSTAFSYTETPTTEGRTRYRQGTLDEPEVPDDFLNQPGGTERFISKRLQWSLDLEFRRSGLSVTLFDAERTDRTEADGTPLVDESQRGAILRATWRVGARTDLGIRGGWAERELQDGDTRDTIRASIDANYRLGNKTTLTLEYIYTEETGENLVTNRDYVANIVSLLLTRTF